MSKKSIDGFDTVVRQGERISSVNFLNTFTHLPPELEDHIIDLTGPIQMEAYTIRQEEPVNWSHYVAAKLITEDKYCFINSYQSAQTHEERDVVLETFGKNAFYYLLSLVRKVSVVEDMRKLLILIDDMIWEDSSRKDGFELATEQPWKSFMPLLEWEDDFIRNIGSRLISILMITSKSRPTEKDLNQYLSWLKDELNPDNPYMISVVRCLQKLLRNDDFRVPFMDMSGIFRILELLATRLKPQAQYQLIFCLWVTSLSPNLAEKMERFDTIPILYEIMQSCPAEILKVLRIIIATYRNLLEKPNEIDAIKESALKMLQHKILAYLRNNECRVQTFKDQELEEDYNYVVKKLESHLKELSSFEVYKMEVLSRKLDWSLVHTSKKFWVENAERLNENKFELVKILIDLMETSEDSKVLCITAHDIGEYMKQHSYGKKTVEELGGKDALLRLLGKGYPTDVRTYALKSLQILMINNYDKFIKKYREIEEWSDMDLSTDWRK